MLNPSLTKNIDSQAIKHWRSCAIASAKQAGVNPTEVDWLLETITSLTKLDLRLESYLNRENVYSQKSLTELTQLWEKRLQEKIPLQYLVGTVHWRDMQLQVSPSVLIPRPETEIIIDIAKEAIEYSTNPELNKGIWVDLGTGSGAIAIALAQLLPLATIYAIDISPSALAIARHNSQQLNLAQRIIFEQGNWWSPLPMLKGQVSAMLSNPPYIPTPMIPTLQPEVNLHEPHLALDGGPDGLQYLQYLVESSAKYLRSGGIWLTEIMAGQGSQVQQMLLNHGDYHNIQIFRDLANLDRFVLAYKK